MLADGAGTLVKLAAATHELVIGDRLCLHFEACVALVLGVVIRPVLEQVDDLLPRLPLHPCLEVPHDVLVVQAA